MYQAYFFPSPFSLRKPDRRLMLAHLPIPPRVVIFLVLTTRIAVSENEIEIQAVVVYIENPQDRLIKN